MDGQAREERGMDGQVRAERGAGETQGEEPVFFGGGSFASLTVKLDPDASAEWMQRTLAPQLRRLPASVGAPHRYLLIGLHACGDLSPTLLRLFTARFGSCEPCDAKGGETTATMPPAASLAPQPAKSPMAKLEAGAAQPAKSITAQLETGAAETEVSVAGSADVGASAMGGAVLVATGDEGRSDCVGVVSVGCCYHLLTEGTPRWKEDGRHVAATIPNFPMSDCVSRHGVSLGEMGRHLATQPVFKWAGEDATLQIRHHFYRCLLECRLTEMRAHHGSDGLHLPRQGNVGSMPSCSSFGEYARLAAAKLGYTFDPEEEARMHALYERHAHLERPLRCFVMLR